MTDLVPDFGKQILALASVDGFKALRYLGRGASALVFEAEQNGKRVALKVFDPEFLAKHKKNVEIERINRQLLLKGRHHDSLIDILAGGLCAKTGHYYIVMPLLNWDTLDKAIPAISRDQIRPLISQIASAAKFLESHGFVHRDIKPPNIAVSPDHKKAILLDLGVVLPLNLADITDTTDTKNFVGTTRYSPPEFNIRTEADTPEGWRAITFYQLGAVLHDLIMRRLLFHDSTTPYQRLVHAVLLVEPVVEADDVPRDLVRLTKSCLSKDPEKRLTLVGWDDFDIAAKQPTIDELKSQIRELRALAQAKQAAEATDSGPELMAFTEKLSAGLHEKCLADKDTFPPCLHASPIRHDNESLVFAISFARSVRHGLTENLHLVFGTRYLGDRNVFQLQLAIGLSAESLEIGEGVIPLRPALFTTDLDDAIDKSLREVYSALALALQELAVPVTRTEPSVSTRWITER